MKKQEIKRGRGLLRLLWDRFCRGVLPVLALLGMSAAVSAAPKVSIVTEVWRPYSYPGKNEEVLGEATDIVLKVMAQAGLDYSIRIYPWSRAYAKAFHDKNTLIYAMLYSEKRAGIFQMIGQVAPTDRLYFYRLKGRDDIRLATPGEARHFVVGASRDSVMEAYVKDRKFPKTRIVVSTENAFAMLERGHVELVLSSAVNAKSLLAAAGKPLDLYMPVLLAEECKPFIAMGPKTDPEVVARVKAAYETLRAGKYIPEFSVP